MYKIEFGPFKTEYHQTLAENGFRDAAIKFVNKNFVSQLEGDLNSVSGTVEAEFNEEKYCGSNSAVRNKFKFNLIFETSSGKASYKGTLKYSETEFEVARGSSLYVWTQARLDARKKQQSKIQEIANHILAKESFVNQCPVCFGEVNYLNTDHMFDLGCKSHCFIYSYHKDSDGKFLHGHFFMKEPKIG